MPGLTADLLRAAASREGTRLVDAAELDLDAEVPGCSGWTSRELLDHVSRVLLFVSAVVRARALVDRPGPRPEALDPVQHARDAVRAVGEALDGLEPDEPCWNWSVEPDTGAFWHRRMAQELLVHRLDAERAVADPTPVDAELAADGVDEFLAVFLPRVHARAPYERLHGTLLLERTDGAGAWELEVGPEGPRTRRVEPGAGAGTAVARGRAEDLLLALWNRQSWDVLETDGDRALFEAWTAEVRA